MGTSGRGRGKGEGGRGHVYFLCMYENGAMKLFLRRGEEELGRMIEGMNQIKNNISAYVNVTMYSPHIKLLYANTVLKSAHLKSEQEAGHLNPTLRMLRQEALR
jgi:hypothetical protein